MAENTRSVFQSARSIQNTRVPFIQKRIRRAAAACYYCHARKVRCDAAISGYPCTNCTLDKRTDCTLRPNATSRFKKLQNRSNDEPKAADKTTQRVSPPELSSSAEPSNDPEIQPLTEAPWNFDWDSIAQSSGLGEEPVVSNSSTTQGFPKNFLDLDRLSTLPMDEVHNISIRCCLDIPRRQIAEVFLRKYFLLIHPSLPILDEAMVWGAFIQENDNTTYYPKLSLFVFQAILLASCAFVSVEVVQQWGFPDTHTARRALYDRAKTLYDTGFEADAISRAQGCLLLTFHTTAEDPEAPMTWNICAIQNSMAAELDLNISTNDPIRITKKRLYWAIFVRDKILWLGRHRRPHFISAEFGLSMDHLNEDDLADEILYSPVYTADAKRLLLKLFQAQCRLAIILTDIVSIVFSIFDGYSPRLSSNGLQRSMLEVKELRDRLTRWKDDTQSRIYQRDSLQQGSIEILTNLVLMHYQSARVALAHYETFLVESHFDLIQDSSAAILLPIAKDLKSSVYHMTQIMKFFSSKNLTENIPISVLAYCGTPMILAAIDAKLSPSHSESLERGTALNYCADVVTKSRGAYDVTEFFSQGTNHLLQLAYTITENVFRKNPELSKNRNFNPSEAPHGIEDDQSGLHVTPFNNLRVKGWVEAFLKYPRAYLSISTCIDYSLAMGRLPRDELLPPLIRDTMPLVLGLPKLPWMIESSRNTCTTPQAERLLTEQPESQEEDVMGPSEFDLDDPWYWSFMQNFNPNLGSAQNDLENNHDLDGLGLVHGIPELDPSEMSHKASIDSYSSFNPRPNFPSFGIITDD
ncbi:hypothetical protein N7478_002806 [Penicillium angulare]|uniref:uncharacterized protein n=1 Tax=Penicillium angulare TaxID=116970 RepID=UPI002542382B|nr:uncharacterized protein N7478_002806 [Penicillium angulare]KAJ5287120.1 hypothetical protein N7478_002806 [Penicillium angulare]